MQVQEMGRGTACYLVSEANGSRSREVITVAQGHKLPPGTVLAQVEATGKYVPLDPANGSGAGETPDGSQIALAVLYAAVDTTEAEKPGVVTARDAEVADHALTWPAAITQPQKTAALGQLAAVGIVVR